MSPKLDPSAAQNPRIDKYLFVFFEGAGHRWYLKQFDMGFLCSDRKESGTERDYGQVRHEVIFVHLADGADDESTG